MKLPKFLIGLALCCAGVIHAAPVYEYSIPIASIPLTTGGSNECIGAYDAKSDGAVTNYLTQSIWFQSPANGTAYLVDTTPAPWTGRMKVIRRSNGQTVDCGENPLGWAAVAGAEYRIDYYVPEAYALPGSNVNTLNLSFYNPANDCPDSYEGYVIPTRGFDGSEWWRNPFDGYAGVKVYGYDTNMQVGIKVIRNDLLEFCINADHGTFYARADKRYKFILYFNNIPPGGSPVSFDFYEPVPPFSLKFSGEPTYAPSIHSNNIVIFDVDGPVHTNLYYQWYYSQTLLPAADPGWIPHFFWDSATAVSGGAWQVSHTTGPGFLSTNRPTGFWSVRTLINRAATYDSRAFVLDPDEPIGYPPPLPPCTNNCGDITPSTP